VTDVRFENEALAIAEQGGIIYYITRPEIDNISHAHASEDFKWVETAPSIRHVGNLGELDEFEGKAIDLVTRLLTAV